MPNRRTEKPPARLWVGIMIFWTTYINYAMRVNMSVSIIAMSQGKNGTQPIPECKRDEYNASGILGNYSRPIKDFGPRYEWDETIQLRLIGSYFWGYVPASVPGGFIAEWIGPFNTILYAHILSGILNSLTVYGAHYHWGFALLTRLLIGVLGGFIYPALQVLISRWAPPAEKGKFVGALMGNTLGTCVTWPLVGVITELFGWDWGFHVISIQVAVFCVIFYFLVSDSPEEHKTISAEEKKFIKDSQGGSVSKQKAVPPYLEMFKSMPFYALAVAHFGNLWGLYLQVTGAPKFIANVLGFDLKKSGGLAALAPLTRMFFGFGFGSIGDYIKKKEMMSTTAIRKFFILFSHILPALLLFLMLAVGCNWIAAVAILVFSQALNGAAVLTNLQNAQDLAPNFAGSIFGINSLIGGTTGFITPEITAALTKENNGIKEWQYNFAIGACVYLFCGIFFVIFGSGQRQSWNEKKEEEDKSSKPIEL